MFFAITPGGSWCLFVFLNSRLGVPVLVFVDSCLWAGVLFLEFTPWGSAFLVEFTPVVPGVVSLELTPGVLYSFSFCYIAPRRDFKQANTGAPSVTSKTTHQDPPGVISIEQTPGPLQA